MEQVIDLDCAATGSLLSVQSDLLETDVNQEFTNKTSRLICLVLSFAHD